MELDVLFWLAIAAIYILQSIASKRRQPSGPVPEQAGDSAREMPPDLQEALGEIGRTFFVSIYYQLYCMRIYL